MDLITVILDLILNQLKSPKPQHHLDLIMMILDLIANQPATDLTMTILDLILNQPKPPKPQHQQMMILDLVILLPQEDLMTLALILNKQVAIHGKNFHQLTPPSQKLQQATTGLMKGGNSI